MVLMKYSGAGVNSYKCDRILLDLAERMREGTSIDIHRHDGRYAVIKRHQVQLNNNKPCTSAVNEYRCGKLSGVSDEVVIQH
jgi:hypothetical protein